MIHIRQLTKTYGGVRALDDVTFSAVPGRITGFLGLNGSGKTTTLRILLGLTRATSGVALINGQPSGRGGPVGTDRTKTLACVRR
jgi:ABC-2 type transport system ATP-binding protein